MIDTYQFIKFRDKSFMDFHKNLNKHKIITCFDLEDNIVDFTTTNTNKYKELYRNKLVKLLDMHREDINSGELGFCISEIGSFRYLEDMEALYRLRDFEIACVFLAKANDLYSIKRFAEDADKLPYKEFIPIIETNDAYSNIEEILSYQHPKFNKFSFGHSDYNLNCNIFPFVHQNHPKYWVWIDKLARIAKKHNKTFVNSPFLKLSDTATFKKMLEKLHEIFGEFGQVCFNTKQSMICSQHKLGSIKDTAFIKHPQQDEVHYAEDIIKDFEKYNETGYGISIRPDGNIISPQEYVAARRFLSEL
jgi:citrate lyase beta subunit